MKKGVIFDAGFMILAAVILMLMNKFVSPETPNIFLYVPILAVYYVGRYVSIYLIKRELDK